MKWELYAETSGNPLTDMHQTEFDSVSELYDGQNPRSDDTYIARAEQAAERFSPTQRDALVNVLRTHMLRLGASDSSLAQLERLRDPRSVAVVTGQQAGLFTGPLYAVYKALSAIGLAARLETKLQRPVVPVFWVASEDHDWGEVDHAYVLDAQDEVQRIRLNTQTTAHQMVFHTRPTLADVDQVVSSIQQLLPEGPYKHEVVETVRNTFTDGASMSEWFAKILAKLVEPHGLVLLDPCLPGLRNLVKDVWKTALSRVDDVQAALGEAYGQVEAKGFTAAVVRDETNSTVFYVQDGERYVLEATDKGTLRARGLGVERTPGEWIDLAETQPDAFSSNVLLRPVVQDHLLPVLAYVGGPAEISYHALSRAVFHVHGRQLPPLLLRERLRIFPSSVVRHMDTWGLDREGVAGPLDIPHLAVAKLAPPDFEEVFAEFARAAEARWNDWTHRYEYLGPQIRDMGSRQSKREVAGIERMLEKSKRLFVRQHETEVRQLRHVDRWLWLDGHAQERRMSPLNVWSRYGLTWLAELPIWGDYQAPMAVYDIVL